MPATPIEAAADAFLRIVVESEGRAAPPPTPARPKAGRG